MSKSRLLLKIEFKLLAESVLNEHALNKIVHTQTLLRVLIARLDRLGGVLYKRGGALGGNVCGSVYHAHKHGGQIQTVKKNLQTLNTNAHYSILSTAMSRTLI